MPSLEHEMVVEMMGDGLGLEELSLEEQRELLEASAEMFPSAHGLVTEDIEINGVSADWLSVETSKESRVVIYLHGGAYVMGSRNTHRGLASRIAEAAEAKVLMPEYRLAPEHPFPAALEDTLTCWSWLRQSGYSSSQIAIVGDSAGGGLALATLLALKGRGDSPPACAVGISPWTDLEGTGPTAQPGAVKDPMMTPEGLRSSGLMYAPNDLRNPLAAPLHGDLSELPPLLLQVGKRGLIV